ncbi:type I restriction endonuclease [Blastococcus sp. BMG 814]|uniref:Type I restriction endonuclease n=1 Tax=Blastococcus carthaginiensis TaxID=3050034 RepID=A0ABT9IG18_9ACTN|nr:type I restriction endonuclease [Blastococcus carthaginiensis]MDP5184523.1 type I restriction endonuclease [Blastococcus carthaginiensis]
MAGHTESDFEAAIEAHLLQHGWRHGSPTDYDVTLGLDPVQLIEFIQETQPKTWAKLTERHGGAVVTKVVKRIAEEIDSHGVVQVLRRGVKDSGQRIQLAFFRPTHGLTPELVENYAKNRLLVYRQLHHSESSPHQSLDLMLAVNGIPVATAELKNHFTGQTVEHAKAQYRDPKQRNPADRIFAGRALAHFAIDPDVVFMTTKLDGPKTVFLPFNQGSDGPGRKGGKGNPVNPQGHRTAYLWEQVWAPDTWLDLLHRYVQETVPKQGGRKVLFPRYHQWDVVERLTAHAAVHGAGQNYLLQHSAGSGKSNSIAWLAHRLADLHSPSDPAALAPDAGIGSDELVFDKVVVITDRRVLDAQLQATISGFEHVQGLLQRIDQDSQQLKAALADAKTKIIITTLQKFPVIARDATVVGKRVAVIVDEAHSSQSGDAAQGLKKVLGGADPLAAAEAEAAGAEATQADDQDLLVSAITAAVNSTNPVAESAESRGRSKNLSFFAFTATPKGKTLQLFGTARDEAGTTVYEPFHLYSMRQAIEEGFILDVLANYVTYKRYYRLANGLTSDDPEVEKGKAAVALARFVDLHPSNLDQRAEIIIEHFRTVTAGKIGGKAKAMVVTGSRLHAVRYLAAVQRYLAKKQLTGIRAMVAFSGSLVDPDFPGDAVTESGLNGFPETQTKQRFHDEGQLLIVAEKYQTGFDEPLLHTMYVDKKLEGVKAVQTLSRLNRIHAGKEDTFVLDFRNTAEEMREQFAPFYETSWTEETDPNLLYNLQTRIENHHVIDPEEQQKAVTAFLLGNSATHATVSANVDPAVLRAGNLPEHELTDLRDALKAFVRAYAFLGQVMKFTDEELESLYLYGKLLLAKLKEPTGGGGSIDLGDTALEFIGHQAGIATSGSNTPGESSGEIESFTGEGRGGTVEEALMIKLSELIDTFNAAHGIDLSQAESLLIYVGVPSHLSDDEDVQQRAADNTEEQFSLTIRKDDIAGALFQNQESSNKLLKALLENETFADAVQKIISTETWKAARRKHDEKAA